MATHEIINACANIFAMLTLFMLFVGTMLNSGRQEKQTRLFAAVIALMFLGATAELALVLLNGSPGNISRVILHAGNLLSHILWGLQIIVFASYIHTIFASKTQISPRPFRFMQFCGAMTVLLAIIDLFTQMYGYFDEFNIFHQKSTYVVTLIFPTLFQLSYLAVIIFNRKTLRKKEYVALSLYVFVYVAAYIISAIKPELLLSYVFAAVSMSLINFNIQADLNQQLVEKQLLLEENRIAIMLSQIQPHFLFNSLTSISMQCKNCPEAKQSILTFSNYLRVNMDSLTQKSPIPFANELEHTKQYLTLEKLRFKELLKVEFDIQCKEFMLPVLTLQPLVENAVRHGVTHNTNGGTVKITTTQTEHGYCIIVQDDGAGFNTNTPPPEDGKSHVGIENVRRRLAAMCGGKLTLKSAPGKGTTATIEIPKKKEQA